MIIRKAISSDAKDMAFILTSSWKSAYSQILSAEELKINTNIEQRTLMFEKMISSGRGYFYLAFINNQPCGLLSFGNSRDWEQLFYGMMKHKQQQGY